MAYLKTCTSSSHPTGFKAQLKPFANSLSVGVKSVMISAIMAMGIANTAFADAANLVSINKVTKGEHRSLKNSQRDQYRNPVEVLDYLGVTPDKTVVEVWPAGGWWTEILGPLMKDKGIYYAAGFSTTADRTPQWRKNVQKKFTDKLEANPDVYDHVVATELSIPERTTMAPPGTADVVLTFRNVHNWMKGEYADGMFTAMYRALKPGGVLGIVEHRAKPGTSLEDMIISGYVTEDYMIELAEKAGFIFEGSSEVNANPKDTADHPKGVWTLPPTLRLCKQQEDAAQKAECESVYKAIGESDRMTMRFRKPS